MQYISFHIKNFKGIRDTTIRLDSLTGASVFALVGLNESGKTTILEAIHSFAPDEATSKLLGGEEGLGVPFKDRVPRHLLSEFTGDVSVIATLKVDENDKASIAAIIKNNHDIDVDIESFPDHISFSRVQRFVNADFKKSFFSLLTQINIKSPKQRKWRHAKPGDERQAVRDAIFGLVPRIAYFPTFVFDFPKQFYLTDRGGIVDSFYRSVFQDILDYDGRKQTIEKDIVRRVRKEAHVLPWASFFSLWSTADDRDKIQHVMDRASAAVTKLVFGRWNRIFGEDAKGKEVIITYSIVEGEKEDSKGVISKTNEHDVSVKFQIKDGARRYDVNDRSLGFRWFFSFMLFTQFRAARASDKSSQIVFLFDEPAANLHAAAQQKLIESFPEVTKNGHILMYSTHSHYMIEPKWLEQTFIVTNRAEAPAKSILEEVSMDDESLDIRSETYRSFVNSHPSNTSYFQPILDRLDVVPSKFDMRDPSVVVEGRSDYYLLRYASRLLGINDLPMIPGLGAGTFGALASLHVGWNLNFVFLLDGDIAGERERKRYQRELGIPLDRIILLSDIDARLSVIEDILDDTARKTIQAAIYSDAEPTKPQIKRFFQESLASDSALHLGEEFSRRATNMIDTIRDSLKRDD